MLWRQQYRSNPYARHLSRPELNKRTRDIFLNLLRLTDQAKIGLMAMEARGSLWMEKWTHVLEEMVLRYGPYPSGFNREILHSEPLPDFVSELADKAARRVASLGTRPENIFFKLGKRVYMEQLHAQGRLRVQPASFFSSNDHNGAIRDDELTIPISVALSRDDIVKLVQNPQDVAPEAPDQRFDVEFGAGTDYWLYCLSTTIEPRLFVDFNADACVIIRDRDAFRSRLAKAASLALEQAELREGHADYIDPLLPRARIPFVPLAKYFGYAYQAEYRFCWIPHQKTDVLPHHDLELGSLADIADLILLD